MSEDQTISTPDWTQLPPPIDDGAASHLVGMRLPQIALRATDGAEITLSVLRGTVVLYAFPRTGRPGVANPNGWDLIPGARGCTPQACSFRDHFAELQAAGADHIFGLSTQGTDYQREAAARLHLRFPLLSDEGLKLTHAMKLPTFAAEGMTLLKRLTMILADGIVEHLFYPVFPPDRSGAEVATWLAKRSARG